MRFLFSAAALSFAVLPAFGETSSLNDTARASVPTAQSANADQGQYARRSVSHLGTVWLRGKARSLSGNSVNYILQEMREEFRLPRFDDNPLPESFVKDFIASANGSGDLSDEELGRLIQTHLAPRIVEIVRLQSVARAAGLRSSQQMNSLVADKTKSLDITGEQVLSIMNSAWLYVPVVNEVTIVPQRETVAATVSMSLLWYHIRMDAQGEPHVELAKALSATGVMAARRAQGPFSNAESFCFRSAAQTCVRQLLKETKEIPDFSLSGQVLEAGGWGVGLDIGLKEGASPNDPYYLVENVEGKDGTTNSETVGWIRVTGSEDTAARRPTRAQIVSGSAYAGLALKEVSLSSWSLEAGYLNEAMTLGDTSGNLSGFLVGAAYTPRAWYGFSAALDFEYLGGKLGEANVTALGGRFALRQSIPVYRRLGLYVEPEISYRNVTVDGDTAGAVQALQFGVTGGLELALLPSLTLRGGVGWSSFSADLTTGSCSDSYDYCGDGPVSTSLKSDGLKYEVKLQWTPPALGFNPLDVFLGQMGM